jgi:hypothetical protein
MRSKTSLVVALFVASAAATGAQQQFQVLASVMDGATGKAAAAVEPTDVRVLENDVEGKVLKVEAVDKRVTLQILLDNGAGLGGENLIHLRNGLRALLQALPEGIETTVVTTAPQPRFLVRATTDRTALLAGVDRLSPDTGAGRFVESLNEATQRIEKEKPDTAPVIITAGTTSGDANVMERDIERLMQRLQKRPTTVYAVVLSGGVGRTASGGGAQTEVGLAVTQMTGGRYENINSGSRLATLLPEFGAEVVKAQAQQTRQYRVTVQRPSGTSGDLGKISMGTRPGLAVTRVTLESGPK